VRGNNAAIIICNSGRYVIPSNVMGESVAVILGEPVWALGAVEDGLDLGGDMYVGT